MGASPDECEDQRPGSFGAPIVVIDRRSSTSLQQYQVLSLPLEALPFSRADQCTNGIVRPRSPIHFIPSRFFEHGLLQLEAEAIAGQGDR